uniref:Beta-glucan synthesis-associated protein n=1 Tax=Peronospora matthiolae TaxID=2874970 RepID=A0AAV1V3V3_9STRA
MSDEFNMPNRSFRPGDDHMWTSLEKPDGVNGALELYSHNMTSTACDKDGTCYFFIRTIDEVNSVRVYNMYKHPPVFEEVFFWYRGAMVQSWNKFCYQGGMLEVRVQLPGATDPKSGNPDIKAGPSGRVVNTKYYPTWPGIWMLGNLGRAIFSASTNRMWPFTYNECDDDVFNSTFQRISACDDDPGYGLNPNQGRGAPEIDILEGAGNTVSASAQIGPGMPDEYRLFYPDQSKGDSNSCHYTADCQTPGANHIDVPTAVYKARRDHKSWYQGMRYASNNFCRPSGAMKQDYDTIVASLEAGITANKCSVQTCPGSNDVNADLGPIDGKGDEHWGINSNGTCFPLFNAYLGSYLCDPDNTYQKCAQPRDPETTPASGAMSTFNYQMDALSSNWPLHFGAYTSYHDYQVEWVTGSNGYIRWMLHGSPLFEIPASSIEDVPQSSKKNNPKKVMIEEPLYIIFNVALSSSWGTSPPNPSKECRGDGNDSVANAICDSFPMYMKIDYIRLYQDRGSGQDEDSYMQVGCDPPDHPTKEWIEGHMDEYEDNDNKVVEVSGKAFCKTSDDCSIGGSLGQTSLKTGKCVKQRCECMYRSWGGPRCTTATSGSSLSSDEGVNIETYGPPMGVSIALAVVACLLSALSVYKAVSKSAKQSKVAMAAVTAQQKAAAISETGPTSESSANGVPVSKENYRQNFV